MPIYEYRCLDCSHEFELMQKFSDPPAQECPTCSGAVQKLISRSAFHLKGDGWYATDYARKSSQNGTNSSKSSVESSTTQAASDSGSTAASETPKTKTANAETASSS